MSMNIALSGMNAAAKSLSVTSNNIANSQTTGFKASRAEFGDVFASTGSAKTQIGAGVKLARVAQQFDQGDLAFTNRELDFALAGNGFFTLRSADGIIYSRAGEMGMNREGYVENAAGARMQVFLPNLTGNGFDTGRMADLRITTDVSAPSPTTTSEIITTLPAGAEEPAAAPFNPLDANSFNHTTSQTVYDSLGASHTQTVYYVKTANANEWEVYGQIDSDTPALLSTVQYSDTGALVSPMPGTLTMPTFTPATGAAPMDITIDIGRSVQYGSQFVVNTLEQNGNDPGDFSGIEVSDAGIVTARYSNGVGTVLGQIALTRFNNPQGLRAVGGNAWEASSDSGSAILGSSGMSGFGTVNAGALENSTVNLTEQLISMITTQRNFQANSQVVSSQDEVLQTVISMR